MSACALRRNLILALVLSLPALAAPEGATPEQAGGFYSQVAGQGQTVQPGSPFGLAVRLVGAPTVAGVEVGLIRVLSGGPSITCLPALTDTTGLAVLSCQAGFTPFTTQVLVTLGDSSGRYAPDFGITIRPPVLAEGITKLQGDRITVPRGTEFEISVQVVRQGAPVEGLRLTLTRNPLEVPVSCPGVIYTDAQGQGRAMCSSLDDLETDATVLITLSDGQGRSATFTVFLLAQDLLSDGITKVSGDDQAATTGTALLFPLVARVIKNGRPTSGVRLRISVSDQRLLQCPLEVYSDDQGLATIACAAGPIAGNGFSLVYVNDDQGTALLEPFRVSVVAAALGAASEFRLQSASPLRVDAGTKVTDALVIAALDGAGNPVGGVPVFFSSNQNIEFSPSVAITPANGLATSSLTFGCPGGDGEIRVGPQPGTAILRIPVEVRTGGPALLTRVQGDGQTGAPGERLDKVALVVRLTDRCFNPARGRQVTWRVDQPGAATLENVISTTDGRGRSSALVRLGPKPGSLTVSASYGDLKRTFELEVVSAPGGLRSVSGDQQTLPRNSLSDPLTVELTSVDGFPLPNQPIDFAVTSGEGSLTAEQVLTDENGRASTTLQATGSFGPVTVEAKLSSPAALADEALAQAELSVQFHLVVGGRRAAVNVDSGFVNGASFQPGLTPGSFASIFGTGLMEGIVGVVAASGPPFPTTLRGVKVTIDDVAAPIIAIADTGQGEQINFQVPFEIAPGYSRIVLSNNGTETVFERVYVVDALPGIFEVAIQNGLYAAALHADYRLVAPADPARPGETILLFLTGLGAISPDPGTNAPGPVPPARTAVAPVVLLDGAPVSNFGGFYAPGLAAAYQVNFTVPDGITTGNHEVRVTSGPHSSQTVTLPVRR
ncbi:MAG: hypothetical protein GC160_29335 [Acidobacteria bacterium]|nr:hypothetical protein [Acidobacteriota bacterium]